MLCFLRGLLVWFFFLIFVSCALTTVYLEISASVIKTKNCGSISTHLFALL